MRMILCAAALTMFALSVTPANAEYISYGGRDGAVRAAQIRLDQLGYYHGPIDGLNGRKTMRAISMFQHANGLQANGSLDYYTQSALFPSTVAYYYPANYYPVNYSYYPVATRVVYTVPTTVNYALPIAYAAQLSRSEPYAYTYSVPDTVRLGE